VASRTVPGSPSRGTVRGTPRLGSGTQAAIGQRRRRPVKSEGTPCYIFRARRYRGPAMSQGGAMPWVKQRGASQATGRRPFWLGPLCPHCKATGPQVPVLRPGLASAAYRADRVLPNDSCSRAVLPRVASVPVPSWRGELVVLRWVRTWDCRLTACGRDGRWPEGGRALVPCWPGLIHIQLSIHLRDPAILKL
jgi:hypothetical protein